MLVSMLLHAVITVQSMKTKAGNIYIKSSNRFCTDVSTGVDTLLSLAGKTQEIFNKCR